MVLLCEDVISESTDPGHNAGLYVIHFSVTVYFDMYAFSPLKVLDRRCFVAVRIEPSRRSIRKAVCQTVLKGLAPELDSVEYTVKMSFRQQKEPMVEIVGVYKILRELNSHRPEKPPCNGEFYDSIFQYRQNASRSTFHSPN